MSEGIHHITAIASSLRNTVSFYSGILGLRLVKRTVNQDDTSTYHLFFGDTHGDPGMDMTFFFFNSINKGFIGNKMVGIITFAVPSRALSFWQQRLAQKGINSELIIRLKQSRLRFQDPDGLWLELVESNATDTHPWVTR